MCPVKVRTKSYWSVEVKANVFAFIAYPSPKIVCYVSIKSIICIEYRGFDIDIVDIYWFQLRDTGN